MKISHCKAAARLSACRRGLSLQAGSSSKDEGKHQVRHKNSTTADRVLSQSKPTGTNCSRDLLLLLANQHLVPGTDLDQYSLLAVVDPIVQQGAHASWIDFHTSTLQDIVGSKFTSSLDTFLPYKI